MGYLVIRWNGGVNAELCKEEMDALKKGKERKKSSKSLCWRVVMYRGKYMADT